VRVGRSESSRTKCASLSEESHHQLVKPSVSGTVRATHCAPDATRIRPSLRLTEVVDDPVLAITELVGFDAHAN
jgi:hypothetical protein